MKISARLIARLVGWILAVVLVLTLLFAAWAWWRIRASLPPLEGEIAVAGLSAPVKIERDELGVPTVTGVSRVDVARALGFLHAQDRFFQMDLSRRSGAGELAELFGPIAVGLDKFHRLHRFRVLAGEVLAALPADQRALLDAYAAGVNSGLQALPRTPWEYAVLRTTPRPWTPEDSLLVIYAMWFDLQDASNRFELSLEAARTAIGQTAIDFFAPRGNSWDAALDGSTLPPAPMPSLRLNAAAAAASLGTADDFKPGSNSFAVSGAHTAHGGAVVENDMHLNLNVPPIWYRAVLQWNGDAGATHRVVGVTLPGVPAMIAGSNGSIAWGYTNSYIDTLDVIRVETESTAELYYRTPTGFTPIVDHAETIQVRGEEPVAFKARWTQWGPILSGPEQGIYRALRWNAHDVVATDISIIGLETARSVDEAIALGHRAGMPNQNLLVADRTGNIAWSLTGKVPRRIGFDGRFPSSWAYGDRRWDGWLNPEEVPVVANPAEGILWTANQRLVGGDAYALLGDSGYDDGPRAKQIRDGLRALVASGKKASPADLLNVALDDRAVFLERWQKQLLDVLTDEVVSTRSARKDLREAVRAWNGRASIDSAAYRIVRSWRHRVGDLAFTPFFERARYSFEGFNYTNFLYEDALWQLLQEKPGRLLNPRFQSWDDLLIAAADEVIQDAEDAGVSPTRYTWGRYNTLRMRHPFAGMLPGLFGKLLSMPAQQLPGSNDLPRVQGPTYGASQRLIVSPGHEEEGILHLPGGQSGNPFSPYFRAGHDDWAEGRPSPLLPGPAQHVLTLRP